VKTEPIAPARIDFTSEAAPRATDFDDVYHPREGAAEQAREVFLAGNGLPERWRGRARFTVLETGFGLGTNFLATWAAWRDDPRRCERLHFVSFEKHPLTRDDLARALAASPWPALARQLLDAWPPLTPNLHQLPFESHRVQLLFGLGDATTLARALVARVDAFFLDGFAPARNAAMWSPDLFKALARQAAPGATAATWSAARVVREGLASAGFEVQAAPGPGRKRDITLARYAPRFVPPRPPGRAMPEVAPSHALIVGTGLAGAATARALVQQGVPCTVLDRAAEPAAGASGNPAGLFHGTVGGDDTRYTRWHRAASFSAARWWREMGTPGAADGLLRLSERLDIDAMRLLIDAQRLPPEYVKALSAQQASERAGLTLAHPAWCFTQGGWADPAALVRATLALPGVLWRGHAEVQTIECHADQWRALDRDGCVLGEAPLLVLANAEDALRLAGLTAAWIARTRGQLSWTDAPMLAPRLPIGSGAYAITLPDGRLVFGATQQGNDDDPAVREIDHAHNLQRVTSLLGASPAPSAAALQGRVGWRALTPDRLPLIGGAPDAMAAPPARLDAARLVPRRPGLLLHTGLAGRGLTSAALGGELLAAMAVGAPWPLEGDLADAVDPARAVLLEAAAALGSKIAAQS
jgi:tRNA 5-methylaminomethyl-2-thiouridine biosynthesis bifunctional protein